VKERNADMVTRKEFPVGAFHMKSGGLGTPGLKK